MGGGSVPQRSAREQTTDSFCTALPQTMALSLSQLPFAFGSPMMAPAAAQRASVSMAAGDVNTMIGKYSVKGTVYDPLGLAKTYDNNWLREAEIK